MKLKDFIRNLTPEFILAWNRRRKKNQRNNELKVMSDNGQNITSEKLESDLRDAGIASGDAVLVHSSLSKIGYLENGAQTFVDVLKKVIGETGTILMPTSPNSVYQYDFIKSNQRFDVLNTPSKTGKITEYFRTLKGVKRSWHPTEPVSGWGANLDYYLDDHFGQLTPYNSKSPFYKISERGGKILYVGVTLSMAGTNLHTLEDAVDFKFPVYADEIFDVEIIDPTGNKHFTKTKVHNPEYSKKRKCDELIPMFEKNGALKRVKIGQADTLVVDAKKFLDVMIRQYQENGVTMYTPKGS